MPLFRFFGAPASTMVERVPFFDDGKQAELTVTSPAGDKAGLAATAELPAAIIWNGMLGGRQLHSLLAHRLARRGLAVVTYDDPPGCHRLDDKTSRAAAATRRATGEKPGTAVPYSRAALAALAVGPELVRGGHVDAFAFLAPAGIVPHPEIPDALHEVDWRVQLRTFGQMLSEFGTVPGMVRSRYGAREAARLPASGIRHGWRWRALVGEVHETLKTNGVEGVVALSGLARTGVQGGTRDTYFPHAPLADALEGANFSGVVSSYEGNHMSPVFSAATATEVYGFLQAVESQPIPVG